MTQVEAAPVATPAVSPAAPGRSWSRLPRRVASSSWVLGAVLGVVAATPSWIPYPVTGLDPSWQAGLHLAARHRMEFGSGIDFTYGPLGFLAVPSLYFASTGLLALVFSLAARMLACGLLVRSCRDRLGLPLAVLSTYVVARAWQYVDNAQLLTLIPLVVALLALRPGGRTPSWAFPAAAGVGTAVLVLMKFNVGLVALGMGVLVSWVVAGRWRGVGILAGSWSAAMLVGWTVTGSSPAHLPRWLSSSTEIASGYSSAMGVEALRGADFVLLVPVVAILAAGVWSATARWPIPQRVGTVLVVGMFGFAMFKHGFVRHDGHALNFFGLVPAAFLALGLPARRTVAGLLALVVVLLGASPFPLRHLLDPRPTVRTFQAMASIAPSPGRRDAAIEASRRAQRDQYQLDAGTLALLRGRGVHVDPWETSAMWAYPEIDWHPLPVFQSYTAYTDDLDDLNADALEGRRAPERILRETPRSIDGRNPDFESPAANLAMFCNYRQLRATDRWQVLGRVPDRCGKPTPAGSVRARAGAEVAVPRPPPGSASMLFARVRGLHGSLASKALTLLYKAPEFHIETDDGGRFRLLPGTAGGPLLMVAPPELGYAPAFGFAREVQSFRVVASRTLAVNRLGEIEVEFFRVPIRP